MLMISLVAPLAVLQQPAYAAGCTTGTNSAGQAVYYCPVWVPTGGIPVYSSTSTGSTVVDRLTTGGTANWFSCKVSGSTATGYGYSSSSWAKTKGDLNGATGWVPAIYYAGAENYWPSLPTCATSAKTVTYTFTNQINGYFCGPASTQIALTSWGINLSQSYLAGQLGTTVNGTNWITDIVRVLNSEIQQRKGVAAGYTAYYDKSLLKSKIVNRVNAGHAVVVNVAGSGFDVNGVERYYGGHYIAVVGYSSSGDIVKIADPAGGSGGVYNMRVTALADWIRGGRGFAA